MNSEFVPITYFLPFAIASLFFVVAYKKYSRLYRKIKNPSFPLAGDNYSSYIYKDPILFIKNAFISPFLWWKIVFEKHKDPILNKAAKQTRKYFYIFLIVFFGNFFLHILASYFNFIK